VSASVFERRVFGRKVRSRRLELGYTMRETAAGTGVSLSTYANWEKGKTMPDGGWRMRNLSAFLRVHQGYWWPTDEDRE